MKAKVIKWGSIWNVVYIHTMSNGVKIYELDNYEIGFGRCFRAEDLVIYNLKG